MNTLPKFGTFLLGHPVYGQQAFLCNEFNYHFTLISLFKLAGAFVNIWLFKNK